MKSNISASVNSGRIVDMMEGMRYENYWQRYAPDQISSGTIRCDYTRISGRTGRMETSRVIYDSYEYTGVISQTICALALILIHICMKILTLDQEQLMESKTNIISIDMKRIIDINKAEAISWTPLDIAFVTAFQYSVDEISSKWNNLTITFLSQPRKRIGGWPDLQKKFHEIVITFQKVYNLKLTFNGSPPQQISGFDIVDISDRGMEGLNFEIEDYENGLLSFTCNEIIINSVSEPVYSLPF